MYVGVLVNEEMGRKLKLRSGFGGCSLNGTLIYQLMMENILPFCYFREKFG